MLGVLIEILRRDPIAGQSRLAGERDIALENLIGVAADFDPGAVAVEGLLPMRHTGTIIAAAIAGVTAAAAAVHHVSTATAIVAAARAFVGTCSHGACRHEVKQMTVPSPWVPAEQLGTGIMAGSDRSSLAEIHLGYRQNGP
jgi:hypothetical protein